MINDKIRVRELRLVGDNVEPGIFPIDKARQIAKEQELDLVPQTDEHDYDFKKKHAEKFLEEGSKLKTYVFFKGRSIIFKDQGEILLLKLAQELEHVGKVDQLPKLEGKRMIMMMSPKKPAK
ncbi:translation initiation factor IF-3 [Chryseobacterium indoltheticum]|uniref:translation initiation factor IF-3 n=1 Tax=Chryseobacterium indoltheticum TaxID=254 RepID=UPI002431386D|nr:translation initiation factor IF-3 [Chryseobacterium indoltheticum]MDF2834296.1 translation initiation factor [Chryseobacterium indoltheticum]